MLTRIVSTPSPAVSGLWLYPLWLAENGAAKAALKKAGKKLGEELVEEVEEGRHGMPRLRLRTSRRAVQP